MVVHVLSDGGARNTLERGVLRGDDRAVLSYVKSVVLLVLAVGVMDVRVAPCDGAEVNLRAGRRRPDGSTPHRHL